MVSQFIYSQVMAQLEFNYETKEWELPGRCLKGFEPDSTLYFSSRYAAHEFIYNELNKELI